MFALLVGSWPLSAGASEPSDTLRVSVASDGSQADGPSLGASVSSDGRYVAFVSSASNLVPGDTNECADVFVRDMAAGTTTRISVSSMDDEANRRSGSPAITRDGRYVAFVSGASNLVPGDTNQRDDAFVRDTVAGTTTRVSVADDGGQVAGYYCMRPAISDDGRYVAFESDAETLVGPQDPGNWRKAVFVRDTVAGTTTLASITLDGGTANGWSASISGDGRYVGFTSNASDIVPGDSGLHADIFHRDMVAGTTTRVSVSGTGEEANGGSLRHSMSRDGRYVAFGSDATNLAPFAAVWFGTDVFLHDTATGATTLMSVIDGVGPTDGDGPSISGDGARVAFHTRDHDGAPRILVRDVAARTMFSASVASDGARADSWTLLGSISDDGRYVAFESESTNLVPRDTNGARDIFLRRAVPSVIEVAGPSRYETAIAASRQGFPDGADTVVIATGELWPDALGGAALAGAHDAPILLTLSTQLPDGVANEIGRLGAERAIVLGGTGAVSPEVEDRLAAIVGPANVDRIGGATRYETADFLARAVRERVGDAYDGSCLVATGLNFPDAVAGGPLAAAGPWPILLAPETGMTASSLSAMHDIGVADVLILGGTDVVSQAIEDGLASRVSGDVTRLAGPTRYETAIAVAEHGVRETSLSFDDVAISTGEDFPDALAGGPLQGRRGSVLLLTHAATLTPSTRDALSAHKDEVGVPLILGSPGAVSWTVRDEVARTLH